MYPDVNIVGVAHEPLRNPSSWKKNTLVLFALASTDVL